MRKYWHLLRDHLRQDFHLGLYGAHALFLGLLIFLNYQLGIERYIRNGLPGATLSTLAFFTLNAFVYFMSCSLLVLFRRVSVAGLRTAFRWVILGLLFLSLDRGFHHTAEIALWLNRDAQTYAWTYGLVNKWMSFLYILIPLLLLSRLPGQRSSGYYGLQWKHSVNTAYLHLLLLIAPVILIASFHPSFHSYYPINRHYIVLHDSDWIQIGSVWLYELFYGLDFINVELLFRGFFVVGLSAYLGHHAILPMVSIYCCLHFGKPMGETISSILGGYILGVLAYYTRSIWGGILVHMGVAWLMEAGAYTARALKAGL